MAKQNVVKKLLNSVDNLINENNKFSKSCTYKQIVSRSREISTFENRKRDITKINWYRCEQLNNEELRVEFQTWKEYKQNKITQQKQSTNLQLGYRTFLINEENKNKNKKNACT